MNPPFEEVNHNPIQEVSDCVVLAGGAGRRMGGPKAFLEYEGQLLIERIHSKVSPLFDRTCVSVKTSSALDQIPHLKWHAIIEDPPECSSLHEALENIIETVQAPVFIVAVDLPELTASMIRKICSSYTPGTSVIVEADDRPQPLAAVWDTTALDFSTPQDGDLALLAWVRRAPFQTLTWPQDFPEAVESSPFRNLNEPGDIPRKGIDL
ncbi:MAG: NTP transferase domain-containing protein [Planctomycetia bacterium]|nr:NTP transferase domain-containing protein [Planctomycetia bacterium]NCG13954.1 NTP transferase domain-containing protein [Planctomycetia bacterium]NCG56336.1 NTP transferase domain-containing protein [Pseudomonadota bacterium]